MVIRQDGQPRCAGESVFVDPPSDGFSHPAQLGIGAAVNLVVALEFERDVVRPSLLALEKAVVESGHGSWGIYTKNSFTAEFAGVGKTQSNGSLALSATLASSEMTFLTCSLRLSGASKYARLKRIHRGSFRPLKDFTV